MQAGVTLFCNDEPLLYTNPIFRREIISYTHVHFSAEEKIFNEAGYPEAEKHIKEHQLLLQRINDLFISFSEDDMAQTVAEVSELLKTWIEDHLMRVDKRYVSFLLKKKS